MKPIGACIFVVSFLIIFASLVRFYVFVMPPGGSKMLAVDVSIGPYQWLGRSPSHHEVLTPVQLLRLQNHHRHTQAATTTTSQTSLAMDQEEKKQVQSIIDQLKGHSLADGGEIVGFINLSSSEFTATNNRAHIVRQYESGSTASERKTTRETPDRKGITFSLFSLEDLRQYFVRKLIKVVSVGILLAIFLFCSKVSLHLLVRSSTQTSASQQEERALKMVCTETILGKIVEKIVDTVFQSVGRHVGFMLHYKQNLKNLDDEENNLQKQRGSVQGKVDEANHRGEAINNNVLDWLRDADETRQGVVNFRDEKAEKENMLCFNFSCPNFISRYGLSKQAGKVVVHDKNVTEEGGKIENGTVSHPREAPPELEFPSSKDYEGFDSRDKVFKDIVKALKDPELNRIGVYGTGGVGKTTMVTKVCESSLSDSAATIGIRNQPFFCGTPRRIRKQKIVPLAKLAKGKGRVTLENLQQYVGRKRKDVAAILGVCVSTFKRMCRQQGIMRWPGMGSRVSKLPDQHGERNTSTACETPSHNVQTGMEVELFGQNGVANVLRQDFMVSRPPDQHGERNTSTACETPSHNVENEMGCQNSKPNEFHPDSFEDLNFWNTDNGSIAEILSDCDFLSLEEEPSLEGSVNLTVAACSDPAQCQHPMPTIPNTMTTTHMMPHLPAKGDMRFVTLKVTYGKKIMKFQFPLMSGIIELKEEAKKRLKLDAPENGARLVRANQSSPIMLNSEKKDTSEGLNGECLTESVLSLDDLTKRKSFPDFDATENKAHLVKAYQSGPVVSLSENKNRGEALKRECTTKSILGLQDLQQHSGGRRDAAAKSFHAIYDPGLHMTDSLTQKSFQVLETLRPRRQQSNATDTDQERQIHTQMCHELSDACGAHPIHLNTYIRRFRTHLCPSLCHSACIRSIFGEQSNDLVPLLSLRRLALKGCVRQDKSPCFPRLLQINAVEQGLTQSPRYSGGLTAQSASSSRWPIGLQDGAHFVLLDPLKESAKNVPHAARQDQCSLTVSLREKKMVRRTLKRKYKTISVIFAYHQQHIGRRCKGAAKSFGATCHCRKHGIRRVSTVKRIHKRLWIHRWPFRQIRATRKGYYLRDGRPFEASNLSMDGKLDSRLLFIHMSQFARLSPQPLALQDGGEIVGPIAVSSSEFAAANFRKHFVRQDQSGSTASLHEGKSARESLDRQGISMSLCIVDDIQQRCGCKHKDAVKRLGVNISMFKSTCRLHQFYWRPCWNEKNEARIIDISSSSEQVFDARNNSAHLAKTDQSGPTMSNSEKENTREALKRECVTSRVLSLENLRQHYGGRHKDVGKGLGDSLAWKPFEERHELWFHTLDSLARKSFEVLDVLPLLEQSTSIRHLVPRRKLALKCWVRLKKSQDLPQTLQMKSSGGLTARSASSLHWSINLTDGGHISVLEKKIVTIKTFKRKCRTMSVSFEDHNRHCGNRCKGAANSLGEKRMGPIWYTVKCIRRQHVIHRCPFRQRTRGGTRGHGGPASSLELYRGLPERVRSLVDAAGFRPFILTQTATLSDHALLTALAERWWDASNTFHLPIGEMTVTPADFAVLTGLRVGGEPIPFDTGIHRDPEALQWFLGFVPVGISETFTHDQFHWRLKDRVPRSEQEEEQMARAYLLYLFGASLFPNKRSTVHLAYLPALFDLRTAARYDWGGAALGTCYGFMGEFSRRKKAIAGLWRVWELWAYEVLKMYPPENSCPDLKMLPRALIWGPQYRGKKAARGSLQAFRAYLDELSSTQVEWDPWRTTEAEPEYLSRSRVVAASRVLLESIFGWQWYLGDRVTRQSLEASEFMVPGPLPPRASHTDQYTLAELQRFTVPAGLSAFLRPERDYAVYQRQYLAGPLGVVEHGAVEAEARAAGEERRGQGRTARSRERSEPARATGLPRLSWTLAVRDAQGEEAAIQFEPARREPEEITGPAPMEWVREAVRLMKAMEKEFHRIASGAQLRLHYPPPAPVPTVRPQGQARAAPRRESVRPPPQKKIAPSSSRPAASTQRGVHIAAASEDLPFRRELRKRSAEKRPAEGPMQKKRREEEEAEAEEEEESTSLSSDSDSVDDPKYRMDPREIAESEEEEDDEDLFDD